eukprot:gb/GEZJ01006146.1/.p1 GENE.gb/GEZJ01006146.1/~~gb/GEZJ01006146.1/.p1  ORF type:complete len:735 (-),score=125.69 gb/GEZJ01006146.1/:117-2192(-)
MPPGETVKLLQSSSESNKKTQASFNELLRFPFLQEVRAGSLRNDAVNGGTPVLHIISEGLTYFSSSQITDVNIVRKLSGFAATVPRLVGVLPRKRLAEVLIGMVTRYAEFANKKSVESKKFQSNFATVIAEASEAIDALDGDLDVLRQDIKELEEDEDESSFSIFSFIQTNAGVKLLDTTRRRIGKYLTTEVNSEQSLISSLSLMFSVSTEQLTAIVRGTESQPDIEKYTELLKDFQNRLRDVRLLLTALMQNLRNVLRQSVSLMSSWYIILQQLHLLSASKEPDEKFPENEAATISEAWESLKGDADDFTTSVADVSVSAVTSVLERNTEVVRRSLAFVPRSFKATDTLSPEENVALSKITTDEETLKSLDAMTGTSGKIVATFNKLLRVPFLDSLHVSAAANTGSNKNGSQENPDEERTNIDLETLTLNFLQRYQKLQAETVPIARNLYSYATLQQRLIPMLSSSLSIENYVGVNLNLIEKRRAEAARVHAEHNKFQQDWNTAILLVERAIAEQEANIDGLKATIKDLVEQKKRRTLGSIFTFIGAALFTAAAVFTGGMLFVLCGAVAIGLVVTGSMLASQAAELQRGINGYKTALRTAEETLSHFKFVLPIMQEVREQLKSVTLIWNEITNKLTDLSTGTEAWEFLAITLQGDEWDPFLDAALKSWKSIEKSVLAYVAQVSDVNPTIE